MTPSLPTVSIEVSARHVHLNESDWKRLFGNDQMTSVKVISQHGQFIAAQRVVLKGPKGSMENVGIVGPLRSYTQVELAQTDARQLGLVDVPLSDSGKLDQAVMITIVGPQGSIDVSAAIRQQRHIHASPTEAEQAGLHDRQEVEVEIDSPRGGRLDHVLVRVHPDYQWVLHLDTDEANAMDVTPGLQGSVIA
jgi:putative phosphotransacetylase